ncbi:MAG: DUF5683 domain-containing protein [bacterium]
MCAKRINTCTIIILLLWCGGRLQAQSQEQNANTANILQIDSYPKGALVQISGKYTFVGTTPFLVPYPLVGKYQIKAAKVGYESRHTSVDLVSNGYNKITIRLNKKTPLKAALRSSVFPGWGQFYGQNKARGFFISMGQTALGIITLFAARDYNNERDEYELALENFNRSVNLDEAQIAFQNVQKQFQEADDALNFRNTMIYVTAGFWFYNILDSIFFFSSGSSGIEFSTKGITDISDNTGQDQISLTMKIGF